MTDGSILCKCGHPKRDHYIYCLNGRDQERCKACDPMVGVRGAHIAIQSGSPFDLANKAADHWFEPEMDN